MNPSNEVRLIESRGDYECAVNDIIARAQRALCIFDRRLSPEYSTLQRCTLLAALLQSGIEPRIQIVLHDCDNITRDYPRLALLARQFSHRVEIFRTLPHAAHAQDSFVVADDHAYVHRFHCDRPRARHAPDDPNGASLLIDRFSAIREASEPGFAATTLGLAP